MSLLASGALWLIRGYQRFISPLLPRVCRFAPTCSEYARQAVLRHGVVRGVWLAVKRVVRCHPLHSGGYDPPPPRRRAKPPRDTVRTWKSEQS